MDNQDFRDFVESMYDKRQFDVDTLIRKVRPFFKTSKWQSNCFSLEYKLNGFVLRCRYWHYENESHVKIDYSTKWGEDKVFDFWVTSNKHFLQKILAQTLLEPALFPKVVKPVQQQYKIRTSKNGF